MNLSLKIFCIVQFGLTGCTGCEHLTSVKKPSESNEQLSAKTLTEIKKLGRDGDWLVVQGRKFTDKLVIKTTNIPLSHTAVLNHANLSVIEAEGKGIHTTKLEKFIASADRLLLIRPKWSVSREVGRKALKVAQTLVGSKYDFLGTIGINVKNRFYCSELNMYIYKDWYSSQEKIPRIVEPGQMYLWGRVLFDSGMI